MKKSKLSLIALILGLLYVIYLIVYFADVNTKTTDSLELVGASIATAMVMPHLVITILAVIFNGLGYFLNHRGFTLVAGILYSVAMLAFVMYFFFVLIQAILCYIAYAKMGKSKGDTETSDHL